MLCTEHLDLRIVAESKPVVKNLTTLEPLYEETLSELISGNKIWKQMVYYIYAAGWVE